MDFSLVRHTSLKSSGVPKNWSIACSGKILSLDRKHILKSSSVWSLIIIVVVVTHSDELTDCLGIPHQSGCQLDHSQVRSRVRLRCRELRINLNIIPDTYDTVGIWWSVFFGPPLIPNFRLSVKNLPAMQEAQVRSLSQEDSLEKETAAHSSTLAWKVPWTEEPGRLQSMGSQRVE